MAGEAIVVPILIDPKAGIAGLKAFGNAAADTGAKLTAATSGSKLLGNGVKNLASALITVNPVIGIAIGAITAFAAAMLNSALGTEELTEAQSHYNDLVRDAISSTAKEVSKVEQLVRFIQLETTTKQQRNNAIKELQKIAPEYFSLLDREKSTIEQVTRAYDNYIGNIRRSVEARVVDKQLEEIIGKRIKLERELGIGESNVNTVVRNGRVEIASYNARYIEASRLKELKEEYTKVQAQELELANKLARLKPPASAFEDAPEKKSIKVPKLEVKPSKIILDFNQADSADFNKSIEQFLKYMFDKTVKFDFVAPVIIPPEDAANQGLTFAQMFGREVEAYFKQTDPIDFSLINAPQAYDDAKKKAAELLAMNVRLSEQISGSLTPATDAFIDALLAKGDALQAFFQGIRSAISQLIKQIVAAIAQAAILSLLTQGTTGGSLSFRGALKKITGFAAGGLVTGPVSALVGEGAGTNRSNPEVIAPLDKLKSFFAQMNGRGAGFNGGNMGIAGSLLAVPGNIQLRASGRDLMGVLDLETLNRRRTG